jgi:hypothetical protein
MDDSLVTSVDVVRSAIVDRIHDLGGSDETADEIALAACFAMWCTACSAPLSR